MSVLQSIQLSDAALKIRWFEQYVSAATNQKSLAANPKGVIAGFRVIPHGNPLTVTIQMDPTLNLSVANVLETSSGPFSLTVVQSSNVNIDLTGQASSTVFIVLDVIYTVATPTTGFIRVVDAAELANADLVVLAKVNVPGAGVIPASSINMGYRLSAGDFTPPESYQAFNQVGNSSFENNSILGWTNNGFDSAAASTDTAHTGTRSLKLVKTVSGTPDISSPFLFALPGHVYKIGAWFRAIVALTGGGAKLQVSWFDFSGSIIGSPIDVEGAFTGGAATFDQRLAELTAPALTFYAKIRVFFDTSSGTLYVDDVQFTSYSNDTLALRLSDTANLHQPNTFTQLNTFTNGVSVTAGDVALGAGNVTLAAALQTVAWPNWFHTQISPTTFKLDGTDASFVSRQFNFYASTVGGPPYQKFEMVDPFGTNLKIETGFFSFANIRFGSEDDVGIRLRQNATDTWLFLTSFNDYDLQAPTGANLNNIRKPGQVREATRKNYVDLLNSPNILINSNFHIWQRQSSNGVSADTPLSVAAGTGARRYLPDRWFLYNETGGGSGAREISRQLLAGSPRPDGIATYACRVQRANGDTATNRPNLSQEIDRVELKRLATASNFAYSIIYRFWLRVGANFSGSGGQLEFGRHLSSTATGTEWWGTYPSGGNQYVQLVPTTTWTQYVVSTLSDLGGFSTKAAAVNFRYVPTGTAGFEDWFEVTGVEARAVPFAIAEELNEDSFTSFTNYLPFKLAGITHAGEVELCQRYYEKSYNLETPPGSVTSSGQHRVLATGSGTARYAPGVRYMTRKHAFAPSYTNWFTHDPSTGNGGFGTGNVAYNYTGPVADFSLDSQNEGSETGFNVDQDTAPAAGDVLVYHWTSDCDI